MQLVGRLTLDGFQTLGPFSFHFRQSPKQCVGVGMFRRAVNFFNVRPLDNKTAVHHHHAVREVGHHAEVMGDPDNGHAKFLSEGFDQIENLCLDRYVERGSGFISNQQFRITRQRDGDHDALAHTAGELMGIIIKPVFCHRNSDQLKKFHGALAGSGLR